MIDPDNITDYNLTNYKLEGVLLFWICASGKTAKIMARQLDKLLNNLEDNSPFDKIRRSNPELLPQMLKSYGIGCYNLKAQSMWEIANSDLNLRTCSVDELESIKGIGKKTSRCFLIHSRPTTNCAGLDVHILSFLKDQGHDVLRSTPGSNKKYKEVENIFLDYVKKSDKSVAELDLNIWRSYSKGQKYDID